MPTDPLDIARANTTGQVIYEGDPREPDFLAARDEIAAIRSELSRLRGRLDDVGRMETYFWFDSTAFCASGALTCVISTLYYGLLTGDRSFERRAQRSAELWEDIHANPQRYVLRPGTYKDNHRTSN